MKEENTEVNSYAKRPLWQWLLLYAVIGIIVYGLFYYFVLAKNGGYNSNQNSTGSYQQNVSPTTAQVPSASTESQKFTVEGNEFAFTPLTLAAKKGQVVEITFKNTGKYPHNLDIADLNAKTKTIQPGEEDTVTFTPDKTGSFSFTCTVPGHADKGMKGTLTVE